MNKVKFLAAALLGVLFTACSEEENLSQTGKTGFLVSLAEDVKVESRSTPEELGEPVASQFNLKITNQVTGSELYNGSYTSDLIQASAGTYAIEATHGKDRLLAVDAPYYKGTAEAELADGESKTVSVKCTVANALASVVFSDGGALKFEDQFSKYELNVLVSGNSALIDGIKSAYYRAGSTPTFEFRGILKDSGEEVVQTLTNAKFEDPATFAAGAHCVITLKIGAVEPGVKIEITKVEVKEVTVSETIPMEWLPKPKVTATGFDSNNTLAFVETEQKQAALNLNLSSALQDIKFKFNFEDEQFASLDKEKEYLLSTDKATIEQALGITLPAVGDKPESIDLSGLIAKLQTNAGVPTNNSIEIDVQANNRWSSDAIEGNSAPNLTYTLTCNKPEFSVSVKPENCWAWEFTVDEVTVTSGDAEKIKSNLVYQYYDGTDWVDCNNGLTQRFTKDENRKYVYLTDNPEPRTYRVRALYRGEILSNNETVATLEEPWQLPNSDMEEWYYEMAARNIPIYYPWSNGGSSFWNTNNTYTTRYHASINIFDTGSNPYNCFPAVSYVVGGYSGNRAVELRNTASGRGNTLPSNVLDLNKVAGELFIGDITVTTGGTAAIPSGDHYTIDTNGRNFPSRPSSLEFWYKYIPTNSDTWQAKIVLMDSEHNVIIEQNLQKTENQENWAKATLELGYTNEQIYAKCQYIYIVFSSTITTGNAMQWEEHGSYILWEDQSQVIFDDTKCWVGSVLTIDNISLGYNK